jgi:hypothetical protein
VNKFKHTFKSTRYLIIIYFKKQISLESLQLNEKIQLGAIQIICDTLGGGEGHMTIFIGNFTSKG